MRRRSLYQEVSEDILDFIGKSEFPLGCRLPTTRDFATKFNVSYAIVRQALIALEARGIIEIRERQGAYVRNNLKFDALEVLQFGSLDIIESLALIQGEAAAIAAQFISQPSLRDLEKFKIDNQGVTIIRAESAFHNLIIRATNNDVLISMAENLWDRLSKELSIRTAYSEVFKANRECLNTARSKILRALGDQDSEGARLNMRAYFNHIIEDILSASEQQAYKEVKNTTSKTRSRFQLS